MVIEINSVGPKQFVSTVKDGDSELFISTKHPRPGCAARDALNYIYFSWGGSASLIELDLKEWK